MRSSYCVSQILLTQCVETDFLADLGLRFPAPANLACSICVTYVTRVYYTHPEVLMYMDRSHVVAILLIASLKLMLSGLPAIFWNV